MKVPTRLACGAALIFAAACQKAPQFKPQDETVLLQSFDSSAKAIRAGMWDRWASGFADNGVFQPANGKAVSGRSELVSWGQARPPMEEMTFLNEKVWGEGNLAYGTSDYVIKASGAPADTGKQLVVFRRTKDGKWWIAAQSFNSDMPLPVPAPKPVAKPAVSHLATAGTKKAPATRTLAKSSSAKSSKTSKHPARSTAKPATRK